MAHTVAIIITVNNILGGVELIVHVDLAASVSPVDGCAGANNECSLVGLRTFIKSSMA